MPPCQDYNRVVPKHFMLVSLLISCSVALSLAAIFAGDSWLVGHFRSASVAQARKKLATRDVKGAITTFDLATSQTPMLDSLFDQETSTTPTREDIIRLVTPMQACNEARFSEVVRIYTDSQDNLGHQIALELHQQVSKINHAKISIADLESKINSYVALWRAPTEEISALLGLRPQESSDPLDIPYYKSGVLASLPKLDRIPDDIATLVDLREAIQKAGGTVDVRGSDAAEQFAERVRLLRSDCSAVTEPFEKLKSALREQKVLLEEATQAADLWCKKGAQIAIDELGARIL